MQAGRVKIGVVAPSSPLDASVAARVTALAATMFGERCPDIVFHRQCFASSGHFAGDDDCRTQAFLEVANDDSIDAVWFARGGYGSCRLLERLLPALGPAARRKTYLGYSDAGSLLGALYGMGCGKPAHGPMPADINRDGGAAAVARALAFLVDRTPDALEPRVADGAPTVAFNITILGHLLGTPWQPDLTDHVLMLEEVSEYMYRIDRDLFHITSNSGVRRVRGIMLGRCSQIPPNDPDFGHSEEDVVRHWCRHSGIPYLGRADIGHDIDNKVVPFGVWADPH